MNKFLCVFSVSILFVLLLAVLASSCLGTSLDTVSAEVSSLSINTPYTFDSSATYNVANFSNGITSHPSGTYTFNNISYTLTTCIFYNEYSLRNFYFTNSGNTNNESYFIVVFRFNPNMSLSSIQYGDGTSAGTTTVTNFSTVSFSVIFYDFGFSGLSSTNVSRFTSIYYALLTEIIITPDIQVWNNPGFDIIYNAFDTSTNTYSYIIDGFDSYVFLLSNPDTFYSNGQEWWYLNFRVLFLDSDNNMVPFSGRLSGITQSGLGWFILGIPRNAYQVSFWFDDYESDALIVLPTDGNGEDNLYWYMVDNYETSNDFFGDIIDTNLYLAYNNGYNVGFADGMDADQTLLSLMWQGFSLPFRLMFGTWDNTANDYVGGLFNFHFLGVDIRAFVLGLMSFAVVLAIVKLILGARN